jgi:hypothetical protein
MTCGRLIREDQLRGFITERNFEEAEDAFPGIVTFYEHCLRKPRTFLELVWQFEEALSGRNGMRRSPVA